MISGVITKILLYAVFPAVIVVGTWSLANYSTQPGAQGRCATDLHSVDLTDIPELDSQDLAGQTSLFIFYHPHCPCTMSTARMFSRIENSIATNPKVVAVAYCPKDESTTWIDSRITEVFRKLSATVIADRGAVVAQKFGVETSGHVLVYQASGRLVFDGGITPGRGHEGDCPASRNLIQKVSAHSGQLDQWPVYGCPIVDSTE